MQQGMALLDAGQYRQAVNHFQKLLKRHPRVPDIQHFLGLSLCRSGNRKKGSQYLDKAYRLQPNNPDHLSNYSLVLQESGHFDKAERLLNKAIELKPDNARFWFNLGVCREARHNYDAALEAYERAAQLDPASGRASYNQAVLLTRLGRTGQARQIYEAICANRTALPEAHHNLANLLLQAGNLTAAIDHYRLALAQQPSAEATQFALCNALLLVGAVEQAGELLESAYTNGDKSHLYEYFSGRIHQALGDHEAAEDAYRRSLDILPGYGPAYESLVAVRRVTSDDDELLAQMRDWLENGHLNRQYQISIDYALGKAHDDRGEYEQAARAYDRANQLESQHILFDRQGLADHIDSTIQHYREVPAAADDADASQVAPLFIMGMPRSGTTLVEQILARHEAIEAGGELTFIPELMDRLAAATTSQPLSQQEYSIETIRAELQQRYDQLAVSLGQAGDVPGGAFITDKLPTNFLYLGLIAALLPQARFVYCARDARDVCLSIYFQQFGHRQPYACRFDDIVFYYNKHIEMMRHWLTVLGHRIHTVTYEQLVEAPEETTRHLLAFLELEWSDACLDHRTESRPVMTASHWQVRQPIYTSSRQRWQHYEHWYNNYFSELMAL